MILIEILQHRSLYFYKYECFNNKLKNTVASNTWNRGISITVSLVTRKT